MARAAVGIAGSAQIEGASRTGGPPGAAGIMQPPHIQRTMIFWGIAVGILFVFHIGGAKLG